MFLTENETKEDISCAGKQTNGICFLKVLWFRKLNYFVNNIVIISVRVTKGQ